MLKLMSVMALAILLSCVYPSRIISSTDEHLVVTASSTRDKVVHRTHTLSYGLDRIDQRSSTLDQAYIHDGTGKGVTVYVFDGGISDTHPELIGRVRKGFTAFPGDNPICNAHGTAVAGAIAGKTLGVAPEAEIVDVKMVQCFNTRGTIQGIVESARWTIKDHRQHSGPAVANWSFIADTSSHISALDSAVMSLRKAGISVIVSAGNVDINACRISPANAEGAFVVGAMATRDSTERVGSALIVHYKIDKRAPDTAWGPCIDIYAPGEGVLLPGIDNDGHPTAGMWSGTSTATGYVSGAAALYLEAHPRATPDEVADWLKRNATQNVVQGTRSPFSRLLYVGPPDQQRIAGVKP